MIKEVFARNQRTSGTQGFVFNTDAKSLRTLKVRQALAYAFDFFGGQIKLFLWTLPSHRSYFGNSELGQRAYLHLRNKFLSPIGRIPDEVFTTEYNPPSTEGRTIRDNLLTAAKLLKEAGWIIDPKTKKLTHQSSGKSYGV